MGKHKLTQRKDIVGSNLLHVLKSALKIDSDIEKEPFIKPLCSYLKE